MRSCRFAVVLLLLCAGCASSRFTCDATPPRAPHNFGAAVEGVFRGGQPMTCGELAFLQSQGVKSILKLNDRDAAVDVAEKSNAARFGLRIESFDFGASTIGTASTCPDVARALAFLANRDNWPVYVHCTAGKDRTGYIVGMYERSVGRSITEVMSELHRYGHRGARAMTFPQIDQQLESERPACAGVPLTHP